MKIIIIHFHNDPIYQLGSTSFYMSFQDMFQDIDACL